MSTPFTAACIQNSATPDVGHNMARCLELTRAAAAAGGRFIALPEYFSASSMPQRTMPIYTCSEVH